MRRDAGSEQSSQRPQRTESNLQSQVAAIVAELAIVRAAGILATAAT
jgi:hypothetical protein